MLGTQSNAPERRHVTKPSTSHGNHIRPARHVPTMATNLEIAVIKLNRSGAVGHRVLQKTHLDRRRRPVAEQLRVDVDVVCAHEAGRRADRKGK